MTKKTKEEGLSMLNRHHSARVQRTQENVQYSSLSLKKHSHNKKSIYKKDQLQMIDKVQLLKQKSQRCYRNAQRKIDKMISIIQQIQEKKLSGVYVENKGVTNQNFIGENNSSSTETKNKDSTIIVQKTLNHLHNILVYQKPLKSIKEEFESFYGKLSQFLKELDFQRQIPEKQKSFLISQQNQNQPIKLKQAKLIERLIKEHYYRIGNFNAAKCFDISQNKINGIQPSLNHDAQGKETKLDQLKNSKSNLQLQNFKECYLIRLQILKKSFNEAINWCTQERLYQTHQKSLEYQLRMAQIKILIQQKNYLKAYKKIQNYFQKFLPEFQEQINKLVSFILFKCQWDPNNLFMSLQDNSNITSNYLEQQYYQKVVRDRYSFLNASTVNPQELAQKFTQNYWVHYNISKFDTLKICYQVGSKYQKQYQQSIKMLSEKDLQKVKQTKQGEPQILPFQINIDKKYLFHSIFVCPVTKQILSSNDGVELLSCGHLVSQSAKKNMLQVRRSNHRHKCPVCQKDRLSQIIKVQF